MEDKTDQYEDVIGTYLVKLSGHQTGDKLSDESTRLLKLIGDFERISDHCSNIAACMIDTANDNLNIHEAVREIKGNKAQFEELYEVYSKRYTLPKNV